MGVESRNSWWKCSEDKYSRLVFGLELISGTFHAVQFVICAPHTNQFGFADWNGCVRLKVYCSSICTSAVVQEVASVR
jgi:hypothetical protein